MLKQAFEALDRLKNSAVDSLRSAVTPENISKVLQATTAAVGLVLASDAIAEEKVLAADSSTPPEALVEWEGAEGPNVLDVRISRDGRTASVTGPANGLVNVNGGCPPPYENWERLPQGKPGAPDVRAGDGRDSLPIQTRSTARTGVNGTFVVRGTFPSRPGQTFDTTLRCATTDGSHFEDLRLKLTAVGDSAGPYVGGSGFDGSAALPEEEPQQVVEKKGGIRFQGRLGFEDGYTLADSEHSFMTRFGAGLVPVDGLLLGAEYRLGRSTETLGTGEVIEPYTHVGAIKVAWQPTILDGEYGVLAAEVGGGVGIGHTNETPLANGRDTEPSDTSFVGLVDAMARVGGKAMKARAGVECLLTSAKAIQACGPAVGVEGQF